MSSDDESTKKILWDIAIKVLFVAVPLMGGWIVKLEVSQATQDVYIAQLEKDVASSKIADQGIVDIKVSTGKLEARMNDIVKKVDKIYEILLKPR